MATVQPTWANQAKLRSHFLKHGYEVGATTAREYDLSARNTVANGTRFTYVDRSTKQRRVGYFDKATGRFTALTDNERRIVSHFRPPAGEHYARTRLKSTYV